MRFYNRQQRERLGTEAGLEAYASHYLLSGILLTIFSTPTEPSVGELKMNTARSTTYIRSCRKPEYPPVVNQYSQVPPSAVNQLLRSNKPLPDGVP